MLSIDYGDYKVVAQIKSPDSSFPHEQSLKTGGSRPERYYRIGEEVIGAENILRKLNRDRTRRPKVLAPCAGSAG